MCQDFEFLTYNFYLVKKYLIMYMSFMRIGYILPTRTYT